MAFERLEGSPRGPRATDPQSSRCKVECKSCESDRRKLKIIFVLPSSASLSPTAALQSKCGTSSIERPLGKKGSYTQKKNHFPKKI